MNLEALVAKIRRDRGLLQEVPGFNPANGNETARFLFLLEAPGPRAVDSGFISYDNADPSARNLRNQLMAAGIDRSDIALWNIIPWYLGDRSRIRASTSDDYRAAEPYLAPLIHAMPNLCCVVLVGAAARQAHFALSRTTTARILTCHHPSARAMSANPNAAKENIEIFRFMKTTNACCTDAQ